MAQTRTLVLSDGDLPAIVAIGLALDAAGRQGRVEVLSDPYAAGGELALQKVRALADAQAIKAHDADRERGGGDDSGLDRSSRLLAAARAAVGLGAAKLVVPWQAVDADTAKADDPDRQPTVQTLTRELDRQLLVTRLVTLDAAEHGIASFEVDAPLADLTDVQVADLAMDLDAPIWRAWWWEASTSRRVRDADVAERAKACRQRWASALGRVGWDESVERVAGSR